MSNLPPDPEGMNDSRAARALAAIETYCDNTGTAPCDALGDLISDLMHLCDREPETFGSFAEGLRRARNHYHAETLGEETNA